MLDFYLVVKYKAPSKERLFLEEGWGLRDVRGPYLDGPIGRVCVTNAVLSSEIPSTISMVLSLSSRCPTPAVVVKISTADKDVTGVIHRDASTDFALNSTCANSKQGFEFLVQMPYIYDNSKLGAFWDVLAIDELTIERFR